jgi:hypothetical protein
MQKFLLLFSKRSACLLVTGQLPRRLVWCIGSDSVWTTDGNDPDIEGATAWGSGTAKSKYSARVPKFILLGRIQIIFTNTA